MCILLCVVSKCTNVCQLLTKQLQIVWVFYYMLCQLAHIVVSCLHTNKFQIVCVFSYVLFQIARMLVSVLFKHTSCN